MRTWCGICNTRTAAALRQTERLCEERQLERTLCCRRVCSTTEMPGLRYVSQVQRVVVATSLLHGGAVSFPNL